MRTHFAEKSKRGRIDLTRIGRLEIHEQAIAHKDDLLTPEYAGEILNVDPLPPPEPMPHVREKVNVFEIIRNTLNIKKYLP